MNHTIYFRRRGKVVPPPAESFELLPIEVVATLSANLEQFGYVLSPALLEACRTLSLRQISDLQRELIDMLSCRVGAHRDFTPMYVNFPRQVMEASNAELYINAIVHYWTAGELFPVQDKKERNKLRDIPKLQYLQLGTIEEFEGLCTKIAASNTAFSMQDREDIAWFIDNYWEDVFRLLPDILPQKENVALIGAMLMKKGIGDQFVREKMRTATDVLRLAVALSDGDVSLASKTKFGKFSRPHRRLLLSLLEEKSSLIEDMLRWKERWKRLGEKLHPREFETKYPKTVRAFEVLRNDLPAPTFAGRIERALMASQVSDAVSELTTRPGDFARRLDHVLRLNAEYQTATLQAFNDVAVKVSTPVLLQTMHHFRSRLSGFEHRVFFPKGDVAKVYSMPNELPKLSEETCGEVERICSETLVSRFGQLPSLGKTYVDENLRSHPLPFATRAASKSLRTVSKGSRISLPDADTLRFFIWWKNGRGRTDIDLSAALFGEDFTFLDVLSYYNLRSVGGCHSGDIVDAPEGASEFIDITLSKTMNVNVRYVAMILTSYTQQPYVDLPECFAGWMARSEPESGEVYEPKTVQDRFDLTADTRVAIPIVFDIVERKAIWCDMALRDHPRYCNNVHANLKGINLTIRSMVQLSKPTIYDLLTLHAKARGEIVDSLEGAETIFSVEAGTPFELEKLASEFMA